MSATLTHHRLRQLPSATRRALGLFLAAIWLGYGALLMAAYFHLTPPSSIFPDLRELDRLILESARPVSRIERLLVAEGDLMGSGGTMRPAFTVESVGWEDAVKNLTAEEKSRLLEEREGERLALLDWIRSGDSREAYENDDYRLSDSSGVRHITAAFRVGETFNDLSPAAARVQIRTLMAHRCASCHSENGRHDTARFIPLGSYEQLEPRLQPEVPDARRTWLVAALGSLLPLGLAFGLSFWQTSHSLRTRMFLVMLTIGSLGLMLACWFWGQPGAWHGPTMAASALVAALGIAVEAAASLSELLSDMPYQAIRTHRELPS